jgi:CRP-like cAMP-binding protein
MPNRVAAPRDSSGLEPNNRLLAALPGRDLQNLQLHLEAAPLASGSVLFESDDPLTRVYFVETGVVALLTAVEKRVTVGAATVGREGAVGVASLLLGGDTALGRYRVLVPGSALTTEVPAFRRALRQSPKLRMACEACTRALLVQLLQAVPCTRLHTVEQRCARWLLMCADRTDDRFELTQKSLAEMLGMPDSTWTAVVGSLAGLIDYRGDMITVTDPRGLEAAACECYRIVRDRCERLHLPGLERGDSDARTKTLVWRDH